MKHRRPPTALVTALLASLLLAGEARAEAPPKAASATVQIGLRTLGWSRPFGQISKSGSDVTRAIQWTIPLILDLGGKVSERVFVGAYLGFSPGSVGDAFSTLCQNDVTCTANNVRVGLQIQLHLRPSARLNPWVSAGVGNEATTITAESRVENYVQTRGGTSSFQGTEYLLLSLGTDYRATEVWGFGPFVALSLGSYKTTTARNVVGTNKTRAIDEPAMHQWLMFGLRGVLFP